MYGKEESEHVCLHVLNVAFVYMGDAQSFFTEYKNFVMSCL